MTFSVHQQTHGYKSGHQLLNASIRLQPTDQEVIDRLSDMAGPLRPNERFEPYLTAYPLPSGCYYVLARTQQDLNAPRAGCVVTRSLLIPSQFWEREADPATLSELLEQQADPSVPLTVSPTYRAEPLPLVHSGAMVELVEALFLEKRVPVAMFEMSDTRLAALRLLTALWPALRGSFSLCTFALSPRYLASRPFDLLFAPKSARSRFSDWEGRRIEAGRQRNVGRHRWSALISSRIFESPVPHLLDQNALSLLGADGDPSENVLRLSLLWDELQEKSATSPTAVLGLLDIAKTRKSTVASWTTLRPAIVTALSLAASRLPPKEAWGFIRALFGKTASLSGGADIRDEIIGSASALAQRDLDAAFEAIARVEESTGAEGSLLIDAIAANLDGSKPEALETGLDRLSDGQIVEFCVRSEVCRRAVMDMSSAKNGRSLVTRLGDGLAGRPDKAHALMPSLLPLIERPHHASLLPPLLQDARDVDIQTAIETIWANESAHDPAIATPLCTLAKSRNMRSQARTSFANAGSDAMTDTALLQLSGNEPADLAWLLREDMSGDRRAALLSAWIARLDDRQLDAALAAGGQGTAALSALTSSTSSVSAETLVRVLTRPVVSARTLVEVGLPLYPRISGKARQSLSDALTFRAVTEPALSKSGLVERILGLTAGEHDLLALMTAGIARAGDGGSASRILVAFDTSPPPVRRNVVAQIEPLARAVVSRRKFDLTAAGAQALANLIQAVGPSNNAHLRVCSQLLPFAMAALAGPASPLVIATFPAVYRELRKDSDGFDLWKLFGFTDWDKCKTARRDLVRAFLRSNWPPLDFATAIASTPDPERFFKRLLKEQGGLAYFKRIAGESSKLMPGTRTALNNAAKAIGKNGVFIPEWDT